MSQYFILLQQIVDKVFYKRNIPFRKFLFAFHLAVIRSFWQMMDRGWWNDCNFAILMKLWQRFLYIY